jgi:hypothetical protein
MRKYIYVVVRTDIPLADQIVQVGHACFEAGIKFGVPDCHMVLLQTNSEHNLNATNQMLIDYGIQSVVFYEPDSIFEDSTDPMGNTALCTEPLRGKQRMAFQDYSLWSPGATI